MQVECLKENIIDLIREEQIKLGYRKESVRLYYPLSSINALLETQMDSEEMREYLSRYFEESCDVFGQVGVTCNEEKRFCIYLPEQVSEYVHDQLEPDEFLSDFIHTIEKHGITIEDILEQFYKYSRDVHFEKMQDEEFDYLIYFEKGEPNAYRYCITDDGFHMIYHRFMKADYEEMYKK